MIERIVSFALSQRFMVIVAMICLAVWGGFSFRNLPIDAYPDLSPPQVEIVSQRGRDMPERGDGPGDRIVRDQPFQLQPVEHPQGLSKAGGCHAGPSCSKQASLCQNRQQEESGLAREIRDAPVIFA